MIHLGFALLACAASVEESPAPARRTYENALIISVDGLRADALLAVSAKALPAFARLRQGASTLNARTDPDWTITLPNHTAMLTGRFVEGPAGHNWRKNDDADEGETLSSNKQAYVAGIFDVAHDRGFETALFSGKSKFSIYDVSWDGEHGAPDTTDADDGRDKLDRYVYDLDTPKLVDGVIEGLTRPAEKHRLYFLHLAPTDLTGHAFGWDVSPDSRYMRAVQAIDVQIARILDAIQGSTVAAKTVVILTADHGGGAPFRSHDQKQMWVDYVIPFCVWTGPQGQARDLYELNAGTRADPGIGQPARDFAGKPPIRNGDAGNLALALLGLPSVPGSTIGASQDLRVFAAPH